MAAGVALPQRRGRRAAIPAWIAHSRATARPGLRHEGTGADGETTRHARTVARLRGLFTAGPRFGLGPGALAFEALALATRLLPEGLEHAADGLRPGLGRAVRRRLHFFPVFHAKASSPGAPEISGLGKQTVPCSGGLPGSHRGIFSPGSTYGGRGGFGSLLKHPGRRRRGCPGPVGSGTAGSSGARGRRCMRHRPHRVAARRDRVELAVVRLARLAKVSPPLLSPTPHILPLAGKKSLTRD